MENDTTAKTPADEENETSPGPFLRNLTDASLHFLANASNETLGACAVGLFASTYLVLGRIGLILIGVVGGIVLHATWDAQHANHGGEDSSHRKRELGIEIVKRVLDWRDSRETNELTEVPRTVDASTPANSLDYSEFQPATGAALTDFTDAVIQNYVKWWYGPILPTESSFPAACRQTFTNFVLSFSNHLSRKRTADPFLDFLANSASIVIVFLNELSTALKTSQRQEPEEAIRTYLQFEPDSDLANVLSVEQRDRKLQLIADDILQHFLDAKAYNFPPAKTFLREVLAQLILGATVANCAKPEWINGWIVYLLEDGEPEILNVIDAGVEDMGAALQSTKVLGSSGSGEISKHQRRVSRAEEAMQEALLEAKRMNEMIAEDEARRKRESVMAEADDNASTTTTEADIATPTSSDSDHNRMTESQVDSSMVFDMDGNPHPASPSKSATQFTNFDQLNLPTLNPSLSNVSDAVIPILTLHNASITIFDDAEPNDRSTFKQKPSNDYIIQIEPATSRFPGWMISRKYADFEVLHETLRRLANISGTSEFTQKHPVLPTWKAQSKAHLTQDLESYLRSAVRYEPLAESDAMKKFLDKETGLEKVPVKSKNVLDQGTVVLENVGKGFINVLGQGGKGIAGGGKAVLGGVQGVFGVVAPGVTGPKRPAQGGPRKTQSPVRATTSQSESYSARPSHDVARTSSQFENFARTPPQLPGSPRPSYDNIQSRSSSPSRNELPEANLHLPPTPSQMTGDYNPAKRSPPANPPELPPRPGTSRPITPTAIAKADAVTPQLPRAAISTPKSNPMNTPITEEETRISIDLIFAIITELYSLSGAWTIRLSLLTAAKTFLLRPNNPQLDSIRALLQHSVIDANFSDAGLAAHITKLRENILPTEEELKTWPAEPSAAEKEKLRVKARQLLVTRGMPQALMSVMGAAASGEALGRVFDCLQVEEVARGFVFALLLQALRAVTQ
jgi:PXA domain/Sorting nexin C terminal/PX domain